jgi:transposase
VLGVAEFRIEPIVVSDEERAELERRSRAHTASVRDARRANLVLFCTEGVPLPQIAGRVGMDQHQVGEWRRPFLAHRLEGLSDRARSGRPRRLGHDQRIEIAAVETSERDPNDPIVTWSYFEVAEETCRRGVEVSVSQVWRILKGVDIDLTKVRGWSNRRDDPGFWDRVRDVCGPYLAPPEQAVVLSVDEKTGIQAMARTHAGQTPRGGRSRRREFEYVRHGKTSLHAALDVNTGEVLAAPIPPKGDGGNNSVNFFGFLDGIERSVEPTLEIHVVLFNGSSQCSKYTRARFDAHPRWTVHYTPPHASWVNQVSWSSRSCNARFINNGNFSSRDDLIDKLLLCRHRLRPEHETAQIDLRDRPTRRMNHTRTNSTRQ